MLIDLAGIAFAGGLFIVPSFAAVQAWSPVERRSRVIAGCNVLSAAFMTLAGLAIAALQYEKVSDLASLRRARARKPRRRRARPPRLGCRRHQGCRRLSVQDLLRARGQRPRKPSEARRKSHHRTQSRKLTRRAADALTAALARGLCGRHRRLRRPGGSDRF